MTKKIFEKINQGGVLDVKDLTPDEKKSLYEFFKDKGMSESTAYLRFFTKGFAQWEIIGITNIIEEFLIAATPDEDNDNPHEGNTTGYAYILYLKAERDISKLMEILSSLKLGKTLCDFMAERGMRSQTTVRTRFRDNDWKPWELQGINPLLNEMCST